jgi:hypothetical protein
MTAAVLTVDGWSALLAWLPAGLDLNASARDHGALRRRRGLRSAEDLLRLALIYGATPLSLRTTAAWADAAGVAALSDVALLYRLQGAEAWLGALVGALLAPRLDPPPPATAAAARRVRLVDATMVAPPGGRAGAAWRLHAAYDLGAGRFDQFTLTDHRGGESLERIEVAAGDLIVADRYYAKAKGLHHVAARGGAFIVRRGLTGCTLRHPGGGQFRLEAALDALDARGPGAVADLPVLVPLADAAAAPLPARLILRRRPPEAAARARARARRKAKRQGQRVGAKRLRAAGYLMLLTSLDAAACPAEDVLALYRLRWQVELAFKRLKSVIGLADLQAKEPRLARACLYAKLILALLGEQLVQERSALSPSAGAAPAAIAVAALSTGRPGPGHGDHR